MDRILSRRPLPGELKSCPVRREQMEIPMLLLPLPACAGQIGGVQRVLDFADGLSGTPGESLSRAHLHTLGFPAPEPQHEVRDDQDRVGYMDCYRKESGLGALRVSW